MKTTNPLLINTIRQLQKASKKYDAQVWAKLANELERPKQRRATVNLSSISRSIREGEIAAVPGKVLGAGKSSSICIAAFNFSETAKKKIEKAGGEYLSLEALIEKNPRGSGVRIIV